VLLNKIDLAGEDELARTEARIQRMNGLARVFRTERGNIDMGRVLNVGGFSLERVLEHEPDFLKAAAKPKTVSLGMAVVEEHCHDGHCDHPDHHHDHTHDERVSSVGIVEPGSVHGKKLNEWLGELLQTKGQDIYRMKGVLSLKGDDKRFVFQGVHMMFDGQPDRPWKPGEERVNKLVFIGKDLNRAELTAGFKACLAG
jgi:G3E family GTPase